MSDLQIRWSTMLKNEIGLLGLILLLPAFLLGGSSRPIVDDLCSNNGIGHRGANISDNKSSVSRLLDGCEDASERASKQ
jgi:hypothetical protein